MNQIFRRSMLSVAGLVMSGGVVAGPAVAAHAAPATAKPVTSASPDKGSGKSDRRTGYQYQAQPNYYYCGPASTRIALSAEGKQVSQDELAQKLGTTVNGTDSAFDITRVLNEYTDGKYKTTEIRDNAANQDQVEQLRTDVKAAVDQGRPVVANIIGTALDVDGVAHSYTGHYLTAVDYKDDGKTVLIADPASPGEPTYWMNVTDLANWIASRGYSS
ncbi:C39 family peptidase [Micromonospora narathiwatensis]|uniref:Peptidase_C39 like family protein n=1 Tax=Micromonospora narathiwatensis TaxID=299146 RepID=A0A1A9ADH5_9ACTN|nr:C39 family peptidase [Micromonospora narathiwatensis]SBT54187.1 Peptidase_C39 like family protein [Micromonospora narathiwatensis]